MLVPERAPPRARARWKVDRAGRPVPCAVRIAAIFRAGRAFGVRRIPSGTSRAWERGVRRRALRGRSDATSPVGRRPRESHANPDHDHGDENDGMRRRRLRLRAAACRLRRRRRALHLRRRRRARSGAARLDRHRTRIHDLARVDRRPADDAERAGRLQRRGDLHVRRSVVANVAVDRRLAADPRFDVGADSLGRLLRRRRPGAAGRQSAPFRLPPAVRARHSFDRLRVRLRAGLDLRGLRSGRALQRRGRDERERGVHEFRGARLRRSPARDSSIPSRARRRSRPRRPRLRPRRRRRSRRARPSTSR
jgi:hypothetical protein